MVNRVFVTWNRPSSADIATLSQDLAWCLSRGGLRFAYMVQLPAANVPLDFQQQQTNDEQQQQQQQQQAGRPFEGTDDTASLEPLRQPKQMLAVIAGHADSDVQLPVAAVSATPFSQLQLLHQDQDQDQHQHQHQQQLQCQQRQLRHSSHQQLLSEQPHGNGTVTLLGLLHVTPFFVQSSASTSSSNKDGCPLRHSWRSLFPVLAKCHLTPIPANVSDADRVNFLCSLTTPPPLIHMGQPGGNSAEEQPPGLSACTSMAQAFAINPKACSSRPGLVADLIWKNRHEAMLAEGTPFPGFLVSKLRRWQQLVLNLLLDPAKPDLVFVEDRLGHTGKTKLEQYLYFNFPGRVYYAEGEPLHQLARDISRHEYTLIVFFFKPPLLPSQYPWTLFRGLSNGILPWTLSGSLSMTLHGRLPPKVLVFTNHEMAPWMPHCTPGTWTVVDLKQMLADFGLAMFDLVASPAAADFPTLPALPPLSS